MTETTLLALLLVLLLLTTTFLLVAYLGTQRVLDETKAELDVATKIGNGLNAYVMNELTTGKTGLSFTGDHRALRALEVWRNEQLNVAHNLSRVWTERHTYDSALDVRVPSAQPLTPESVGAIGQASMEYQPKIPEAWREIDPKQEGDFQ